MPLKSFTDNSKALFPHCSLGHISISLYCLMCVWPFSLGIFLGLLHPLCQGKGRAALQCCIFYWILTRGWNVSVLKFQTILSASAQETSDLLLNLWGCLEEPLKFCSLSVILASWPPWRCHKPVPLTSPVESCWRDLWAVSVKLGVVWGLQVFIILGQLGRPYWQSIGV